MDKSRFRQMEDEMSRFEAEIAGQHLLQQSYGPTFIPGFGAIPPPPQPPAFLIPHQVSNKLNKPRHDVYSHHPVITAQPAIVSAKPTLYTTPKVLSAPPQPSQVMSAPSQVTPGVDFMALQNEVEKKLKKLKNEKVSAELAISQGKASSALQSFGGEEQKRRGPKNRKLLRTAGGQTWEDNSLSDWPDDDFRIFCGDLGNDVTDELLTRTFNKYPSFQRAKVIRDKRTNKTKGYGFISFKDPSDFTRAMKEINETLRATSGESLVNFTESEINENIVQLNQGSTTDMDIISSKEYYDSLMETKRANIKSLWRYVGSRPIKLRKSTWRQRSIDVVKKKEKEKAALLNLLTSGGH